MKRLNKLIVAIAAAISFSAINVNTVNHAEASPVTEIAGAVVEALIPSEEIRFIIKLLADGTVKPDAIANKYKNPDNRKMILDEAIADNSPAVEDLRKAFCDVPGEEELKLAYRYKKENNMIEAVYYFKKSAELGNLKAACEVGAMYRDGWGVDKDMDTARTWFRHAAYAGYTPAYADYADSLLKCRCLGGFYNSIVIEDSNKSIEDLLRDAKEGIRFYKLAAEAGDPRGYITIAWFYKWSLTLGNNILVRQNFEQAINHYRMARDTNTALGYYEWGLLYNEGELTPTNYAEAAKWYKLAMDMGHEEARKNLANLYNRGGYGLQEDREYATAIRNHSIL